MGTSVYVLPALGMGPNLEVHRELFAKELAEVRVWGLIEAGAGTTLDRLIDKDGDGL